MVGQDMQLWALYEELKDNPNVNQDKLRELMLDWVVGHFGDPDVFDKLTRLSEDIHKDLRSKSLDYILGVKK